MNLAIVGCGYVGTAVARHLRQQLNCVITATTTTQKRVAKLEELAQRVVVIKGDNQTSLRSVVENQQFVFLSVAPVGDKQVDADGYEQTYIPTAKNLVALLKELGTVNQLIYTSSCSVYGNSNGEWVNEESPVAPVNRLGEILCETEQILLAASSANLKVCIFRLGGIYGPGRQISDRSGLCGTSLPGEGDNFTNWIHLDDIVGAVHFALQNRWQGIYNLVNDVPVITRQLLERVCERHGLPNVEWDPSRPQVRPHNVRVSNQKIKGAGYRFIQSETVV